MTKALKLQSTMALAVSFRPLHVRNSVLAQKATHNVSRRNLLSNKCFRTSKYSSKSRIACSGNTEGELPTDPMQVAKRSAELAALEEKTPVQSFLFPDPEELPDDVEITIWEHFDELRERVFVAAIVSGIAIVSCFLFSRDLVVFLEDPVVSKGVRFLQLSPGEYFFTTVKTSGYTGLLLAAPSIIYEVAAFVIPGLTLSERRILGPIVLGSSILFYAGIAFSYAILVPAALNFFVSYSEGAVESLWSIDQYFEFVLVLLLGTGLSFQVPVIQILLGTTGIVSSEQMFSIWRYVVVGAVIAAAVITPSTDPFTQTLLAGPLIGLYFGGATAVRALETSRSDTP